MVSLRGTIMFTTRKAVPVSFRADGAAFCRLSAYRTQIYAEKADKT
jgi:hypothetical protein